MSRDRQENRDTSSLAVVSASLDGVLSGIRVPNLPYPVGKLPAGQVQDWRPLLLSCWVEQRDEQVTRVIDSVSLPWTVRQVNSAYIADRIMDVFLKTSGLHPELAARIARLRFLLAWRLDLDGARTFDGQLASWLDSLWEWRGWSNSGGRSARVLLDQLDSMLVAVSASFETNSMEPFEAFCRQWQADAQRRLAQAKKLRERLLTTEQGAATQRRAEQTARALVGRSLQGRRLPPAVIQFLFAHWLPLLKQAVWGEGTEGQQWRHGKKLLEWLVWVGDPGLSDKDKNRLYQVGEHLGDRIAEVWQQVMEMPLPQGALAGIEAVMVARLRGENPELVPALAEDRAFDYDTAWLTLNPPPREEVEAVQGSWFVEGEGKHEHRRYFFALLNDSYEILWTNGTGVKLGLSSWQEFARARKAGTLRPLPPLNSFGSVLTGTVTSLAAVYERQRVQREKASAQARSRAEALRQEREAAEQQRRAEDAARQAELERRREEEAARRKADRQAEAQRLREEQEEAARKLVDGIKLGGWIALASDESTADQGATRLKLAVRINASRKLVFVDRLGLNRKEFLVDQLVDEVVAGRARVLGSSAEFDDTLTRVVGRIRVGR